MEHEHPPGIPHRAKALVHTEPLKGWLHEIEQMRRVLEVWDLVHEGKDLSKVIGYDSRARELFCQPSTGRRRKQSDSRVVIASEKKNPPILERFERRQELTEPALEFIREAASEGMRDRFQSIVDWKPDRTGLTVAQRPTKLIGGLWLQFVQTVGWESSFRTCIACGKHLHISPEGGFRSNRRYCSGRCRQKVNRLRMKARERAAEGKHVNDIAKELDVGVDVLSEWLKASRTILREFKSSPVSDSAE